MTKKLPGVYVHLPFCSVHCTYCDFPLTTRVSLSPRYYEALLNEIQRNPPLEKADTLYFGGGTPSLAPVDVLQKIIGYVKLQEYPEITIEVNPDHVTPVKLAEWKAIGINRLSLGVQSLEKPVLKAMLRQHTPEEALESLRMCRRSGFDNVNVDIILGFPKQTTAGFLTGLESLIELQPEHVSIYLLELHEKTALFKLVQKGQASVMPEEEQIGCFEQAIHILKRSGREHYEVSNFAVPGKESGHNLKYWTDAPYFAYGAGACAYLNQHRTRNYSDIVAYIEAMEKGQPFYEEVIEETADTRARNALIFGLRKINGINIVEFINEYGYAPHDLFGDSMKEYLSNGFLELSQNQLRLTQKGMLLSNEILSSAL